MPEAGQSRRDIFLGAGAASLAIGCLAACVNLALRGRLACFSLTPDHYRRHPLPDPIVLPDGSTIAKPLQWG